MKKTLGILLIILALMYPLIMLAYYDSFYAAKDPGSVYSGPIVLYTVFATIIIFLMGFYLWCKGSDQ